MLPFDGWSHLSPSRSGKAKKTYNTYLAVCKSVVRDI